MLLNFLLSVLTLVSPNGEHRAVFHQEKAGDAYEMRYSVQFKGMDVIRESRCGLNMDNRVWEEALGLRELHQYPCWMDAMEMDSITYFPQVDSIWHPFYGERSEVSVCYNSATIHLSRKGELPVETLDCPLNPSGYERRANRKPGELVYSDYRLDIEVRAYNEGIAFRYFLPEHPNAIFHKVVEDLTEYTLPAGTNAWSEQWAQAFHEHKPVGELDRPVEMALTMDYASGIWATLMTADVDDWCLTKLQASSDSTLKSVMYSPVDVVTYYATPWKVIMAAERPGALIEHNDLINVLSEPCAIADAEDWVIPGTIMREPTLTMEGARATIDFCAEHNIRYMLFDWKWYNPCTSHDGDATKVIDRLDMPEVCRYAASKGVGVWLYVNQHALMKQARELFPVLKSWGVTGVKSGFVQYASHRWATWVHDLVRLAAENHLLMNIHDEFRPTGFSRTYPNLLTQEGICGNEEFPDATHNVTLPFTRMINGAADYTVCYYDKRLRTTHGHQIAASLVFYSPLLTIFWYDRPAFSHNEPELTWFDNLSTVWDETRVLDGAPGVSITMARRKGDVWYVAAMTGNDGRNVEIDLSGLLTPGKTYRMTCYTDDPTVETATQVRVTETVVKAKKQMKPVRCELLPSGGAAWRIEPLL